MFFILNNENAVLAADEAFLKSVGTTHIFLLAERFRFGDFQLDEENRTCLINGKIRTFTKSPIQTILGGGSFYRIDEEEFQSVSEAHTDETDSTTSLSPSILIPEPDIPSQDHNQEVSEQPVEDEALEEGDDMPLATLDQPETSAALHEEGSEEPEAPIVSHEEQPSITEPEAILPDAVPTSLPETPEPETLLSETDTLELPSLDLPQAPAPDEENVLTMLDDETIPATETDEEIALPDWLEDHDASSAPETPVLSISESQEDTKESLLDPSDLTKESTTATSTLTQLEEETISDLLNIQDEPESTEAHEDVGAIASHVQETQTHNEDEEDFFDLLNTDTDDKEEVISLADTDEGGAFSLKGEEGAAAKSTAFTGTYQPGSEPLADYTTNAEMIGITREEYLRFLRQFTEESLQYKTGLESNDLHLFKKNLLSMKDAAQLLHLPRLSQVLEQLEDATSKEREHLVDYFYGMIQHIQQDLDREPISSPEPSQPKMETDPKPKSSATTPPTEAVTSTAFSLEAVEPIPFDFNTQVAADDLGLPESLVQEFVSDFIQQAKENLSVFEEAQRTNDIDTIQKTAHLLKGAASNLRIDPLAETLDTLQYNESPSATSELLQTFVGQLKTLVTFIEE